MTWACGWMRLGLTGPVPAALGQLTQLTALDLRGNELTGEVPAEPWTP